MEPQVAPLHAILELNTDLLVQHDSYHIGQLGFLRRQLGKPAMAYTRGVPAD